MNEEMNEYQYYIAILFTTIFKLSMLSKLMLTLICNLKPKNQK